MSTARAILAMLAADFRERTRRTSFLLTLGLVLALGYGVNAGTILIKLDGYRGLYNSAWVGSLMALVVTFFLGIIGFYLVKNTIARDERTGVGQIIATTPITRAQYLVGKWLSNFAVLAWLVAILAMAAALMQALQREVPAVDIGALFLPLLLISLPMMALVAALAVFFETISLLKGGFGNLVYFVLFAALFAAGIFFPQYPWIDAVGFNLVGGAMRAAARAAVPGYDGSFVFAMISDPALKTFMWNGLEWTADLVLMRLAWLAVSFGVVLAGTLFFDRFNPTRSAKTAKARRIDRGVVDLELPADPALSSETPVHLTPLAKRAGRSFGLARLAWLEGLLLVKGQPWYWWAGMAALWLAGVAAPANLRGMAYMLALLWPVLVWSRLGEREARWQTGQIVATGTRPALRLTLAAWLAGTALTAAAASGALLGRALGGEALNLSTWLLSVVFIPTLALALGALFGTSQAFEVIYPILWYLGPFNRESGLAVIDFLGIHARALVNTAPAAFLGISVILLAAAYIGRRRQLRA